MNLYCVEKCNFVLNVYKLHVFGLIGTASHPDMQKMQIFGLIFENRQFEVRLLLVMECTSV